MEVYEEIECRYTKAQFNEVSYKIENIEADISVIKDQLKNLHEWLDNLQELWEIKNS